MNTNIRFVAIGLGLLALAFSASTRAQSNLTSFDYPGSTNTQPTGLRAQLRNLWHGSKYRYQYIGVDAPTLLLLRRYVQDTKLIAGQTAGNSL